MSLIVTAFVPTGIVMSGDSRTTLVLPQPQPQQHPNPAGPATQPTPLAPLQSQIHIPIVISDATHKVFLLFNKFGVSTFGRTLINGMPIAGHIE